MVELRIVGGNVEIYDGSAIEPVLVMDRNVAAAALLGEPFPTQLTPELLEILGMQNFNCCPMAHAFQAAGYDIPKKTEAEQAFILHWLTTLALKHGADWRIHAGEELGRVIKLAEASVSETDDAI